MVTLTMKQVLSLNICPQGMRLFNASGEKKIQTHKQSANKLVKAESIYLVKSLL